MVKRNQRWEELVQLTVMARDIELAKLSELKLDLSARKSVVAELKVRQKSCFTQSPEWDSPDMVQISGADSRWLAWLEVAISKQNTEISRKMGEFEMQSVQARRAFGRSQTVRSLSKKSGKS